MEIYFETLLRKCQHVLPVQYTLGYLPVEARLLLHVCQM